MLKGRFTKLCKQGINKWNLSLILLILLQVFFAIYWGMQKNDYHIDEIYSYGLSNSFYDPFLRNKEGWSENWHEGKEFFDYVTVNEEDDFSFDSVVYNQSKDVHPPIYYFCLHLISSLQLGVFSKWQGLALNLFFFTVTLVVIYVLTKEVLENRLDALMVVGLYGFSAGAMSTVVYIRMYMLLTLLCTCDGLLHIKMYRNSKKRYLVWLYIITALGFMTQYYFVIEAFFISAVYFFVCISTKEIKRSLQYACVRIGALLSTIVFYPYSLKHLFGGYRGKEAIGNFVNIDDFVNRIQEYLKIIEEQILSKEILIILLLICFSCALCLWVKTKRVINVELIPRNYRMQLLKAGTILFCAVMYSLVITKISPYRTDRYLFCVYPFYTLAVYALFRGALYLIIGNKQVAVLIVSIALMCGNAINYNNVNYLYRQNRTMNDLYAQYSGCNVLWVCDESWKITELFLKLFEAKSTFVTSKENLQDENKTTFNKFASGCDSEEFLVFESKEYEKGEVIQILMDNKIIRNARELFATGYCNAYVCTSNIE